MGLDFTSIPDREGVALYVIHDGSVQETNRWKEYIDQLNKICDAQTVIMSLRDSVDAKKIMEFYGIEEAEIPVALAVQDDDELAYKWVGEAMPNQEEVAHLLEEVGTD